MVHVSVDGSGLLRLYSHRGGRLLAVAVKTAGTWEAIAQINGYPCHRAQVVSEILTWVIDLFGELCG